MIGKCLWKMNTRGVEEDLDPSLVWQPPTSQSVLNAFIKAVKTAPERKDSRQEPVLEPHYKIVSMVNKFAKRGDLLFQAGADILQQQPYAPKKGAIVDTVGWGYKEWDAYTLECLRHLRNVDKQHWHHRTIARIATILFDELNLPEDPLKAYEQTSAACNELRDSIFTKTMHIQVWKPDAERSGRHCVYMQRYIYLMVRLLFQLNDKAGMEALVKRARKREIEIFEFENIWHHCCVKYLKLIRVAGRIPANADDFFKNITAEGPRGFYPTSDRLTQWMNRPDSSHPALTALRETVELKKLNNNNMKTTSIDDLINDAWAVLYTEIALTLPVPPSPAAPAATPPKPAGPMSLVNLVNKEASSPVGFPGAPLISTEPTRPPKLGIPRKEVVRQAEHALQRAEQPKASGNFPSTTQSTTGTPMRPGSSSVSVVIHTNSRHSTGTGTPVGNGTPNGAKKGDGKVGEREREREGSSAPGSLHDSADDESDLSDVPDMDDGDVDEGEDVDGDAGEDADGDAGSIFPNLGKGERGVSGSASGSVSVAASAAGSAGGGGAGS